MGQRNYKITACKSCRIRCDDCQPGYELISKLQNAVASAGSAVSKDFEISGYASVTGCDRACTLAYYGSKSSAYVFGGIEADTDIRTLISYAKDIVKHENDGCFTPDQTSNKSLTNIPSAMIAMEYCEVLNA